MRFFRKIITVIRWIPVIWKNSYDWDYSYLVEIIEFKLNRMADCIESNDIIVDSKKVAKEIRETVELFDKSMHSYKYLKKPENAKAGFRDGQFYANKEFDDFIKAQTEFEDNAWKEAWDNIRDKGRGWWD